MKITAEEKMMYMVMEAIYNSGIPISFKGSMVLRACLLEAGYADDIRHTVDIDANWNSNIMPTTDQMIESLQKAIDRYDLDLKVTAYRKHDEGRSAGFELRTFNNEILFTMDIDVNRPKPETKIYEIDGLRFRGVAPIQMIADKISVVSTDNVFRRIKDVVDLYYISKVFSFDTQSILNTLNASGRKLGSFDAFLHRIDEIEHSYEKFRFDGGISKPLFGEIYDAVKDYIQELL